MIQFKEPTTYEEAVSRKEALLDKLNKYNEELLEDKEPSYSEEEIALIKEEYDFLDCYVDIDAEFAKTEETEKKFLDKVNFFVWIYAIFMFFANMYFIIQNVGYSLLEKVLTADWFNYPKTAVWFLLMGLFLIYPVILFLIGLFVKLFAFKKDLVSKKAFKFVFIGQIIYLIINFVISYISIIHMCYQYIVGV